MARDWKAIATELTQEADPDKLLELAMELADALDNDNHVTAPAPASDHRFPSLQLR